MRFRMLGCSRDSGAGDETRNKSLPSTTLHPWKGPKLGTHRVTYKIDYLWRSPSEYGVPTR